MKTLKLRCLLLLAAVGTLASAQKINVICTTDIHGSFFPYDFVSQEDRDFGMAHVSNYVRTVRDTAENVMLLDCGDVLQGTPVVYYYNFVDTVSKHVAPKVLNYMKYDAVCIGNHDIETTHAVYDKYVRQCEMPILGANAVRTSDGKPYFEPYKVFEIAGRRIAVLGLVTPHIPHWLHSSFWSGMEFEDMVESAAKWMAHIRATEKPDAVIGLFHAGIDHNYGNQNADTYKNENAVALVAERVPGFDAILFGHDHKLYNGRLKSSDGSEVVLCDAGVSSRNVALLTIDFKADGTKKVGSELISVISAGPDKAFLAEFAPQIAAVKAYAGKEICMLKKSVRAYESLFGSSAFVDMVHRTMLAATGADISFSAPLLIDVTLPAGMVTVGRMFSIYRYENSLYALKMTGAEVKDYLEYSYNMWVDNPETNGGNLLKVNSRGRLLNKYYNFDSAAGIDYEVDVTKPKGHRVSILRMSDGRDFDPEATYTVAVNSYRGNGGGGHLEFGAGIPSAQLGERIVRSFNTDLRYLMIQDFAKQKTLDVRPLGNWKFVPESIVAPARKKQAEQFR